MLLLPSDLLSLLLLSLAAFLSKSHGYDRSINYWEAFAPGKLLQRLDAITDVDGARAVHLPEMKQLVENQPQAQAQEKLDEDVDTDAELDVDVDAEAEADEVDSHSAEGFSGEDYEHNYENFVKAYFDRAAEDEDDDLGEETRPVAANVRKDEKCRKTKRKDGQVCEICRQPKNNEVSETCSYSHDDQPEKYSYGSGTQYKKYRQDPETKADDADERKASTEEQVSPSSLCVRRQQGKSVCYECQDSKGQKIKRCYKGKANAKSKKLKKKAVSSSSLSHKPRKPRSQQSQQSEQEQRIYKRTISYSYAQEMDGTPVNRTLAKAPPLIRRRRLVKIRRRRGPVPVQ
ncbi:uncharacterized protein Dana_GF15951 [Drosophila ananassae]|uniref:Uncharacterized protein n=1 Tax=Drosophila ananassae TaxID=7217 RepID=B3N138_DROAN|nr:uncharacterized protein LOC6498752 [Drosophila ananassae]EDV30073.1 uncharacterized protein Dana_GF15951 [Drosophila ananassae]